jgi:N-acetylneuraminate lyase
MNPFHGVWPALITPNHPDGEINYPVLRALIDYLIDKGIDGLYVGGTTGEGMWMTCPERMQMLESVLNQVKGRIPVIVHVGSLATREAVHLAQHAQRTGAQGVSSVLPPANSGMESILLHYTSIAEAAPNLPFFPYLFGGQVNAVKLFNELLSRIPNLGGAKYTSSDMFELWQLVEMGSGEWTIFSGMDEQCLCAAMNGARGCIGSTLNLMPSLYRELRRLHDLQELVQAQTWQIRANQITRILIKYGFLCSLREAMRMLGFDTGVPRLPFPQLAEENRDRLHADLIAAGFAELTA